MTCICGLTFLPSLGFREACIEMESGLITRIFRIPPPSSSCMRADIVLPGFVDLHVHMRGLNQRQKGEWRTESLAALRGGIAVVADMPNNIPKVDSREILEEKLKEANRESYVDFLLYTAYPYLPEDDYVAGIKLYPEDLMNNLNEVFRKASKMGKIVVVHAESPLVLKEADIPDKVEDHWIAHPELAEEIAVRRVLWMAERHYSRIRIAHATLPITVSLVQEAKLKGVDASVEVTPHHILFSREDAGKLGSLAKVNPPLRSKELVNELKSMLWAGMIDFLATDHAPHSLEEKSRPYEEMPSGIPWLDVMAPFLMTLVADGKLPAEVIDMYSSKPAMHMGLGRGSIAVGNSADLVILKKRRWRVHGDELYTRAKSTAIEGMELGWQVERVFLRGVLAYDEGPVVEEGFGVPAIKRKTRR